jgi:hypothetical protein
MRIFVTSAPTLVLGLLLATGCASTSSIPSGMKADEFVAFGCDEGKRMTVRAASDGSTVRLRYEGGRELDRKQAGVYEADGWKLTTQNGVTELIHNGKVVLKNCKPA